MAFLQELHKDEKGNSILIRLTQNSNIKNWNPIIKISELDDPIAAQS